MKGIIYLSLLLIGLQFHCYHLIPPQDVQDNNPTELPSDSQQPTSEDKCHSKGNVWHKIVPFNADFAFRLYKHVASNQTNVFFSPLSISVAFAMLSLGARSETQNHIYKSLAFNLSEIDQNVIHSGFCQLIHQFNLPREEMMMKIGNVLFLEESLNILPKFLKDIQTFYHAEALYTNFLNSTAAKQQINDYVKKKSYGEIVDTVEDLTIHTIMVLVNYVYFKDYWRRLFNPVPKERKFFGHGNETVGLNFMHIEEEIKFLRDEDLSCSVVEIPYSGESIALFILPDKGKLKDVESSLVKENLESWRTSFQRRKIKLWLPKFSISASYDVKNLFHRLDGTSIFDSLADLSGITGKHNLQVTEAVHKANLVVQEYLSEGVARLLPETGIFPPLPPPLPLPHLPPLLIKFNRPFLMFIIDPSKSTIILMGKIVKPIKQ